MSKALKGDNGGDATLPGLDVQNVIASGQSQSAARLTVYYNTIRPAAIGSSSAGEQRQLRRFRFRLRADQSRKL